MRQGQNKASLQSVPLWLISHLFGKRDLTKFHHSKICNKWTEKKKLVKKLFKTRNEVFKNFHHKQFCLMFECSKMKQSNHWLDSQSKFMKKLWVRVHMLSLHSYYLEQSTDKNSCHHKPTNTRNTWFALIHGLQSILNCKIKALENQKL